MGRKDERKGVRTRNYIDGVLSHGGLTNLTADRFLDIFNHYDKDGNRFLENKELDRFLRDLLDSSVFSIKEDMLTANQLKEMKGILLEEFDTNDDGKLSIRELSALLPEKEAFFLLFRLDESAEFQNGLDYMRVWRKYDKDLSGYIEINELRNFLWDIIGHVRKGRGGEPDRAKVDEYADKIMDLFDTNKDGKLGLGELSRMLPARENFVQQVIEKAIDLEKLSEKDVKAVLDRYDRNGDGYITGAELTSLVGDMLASSDTSYYNPSDVYELQRVLLKSCDLNGDGKIDRRELQIVLLGTINAIAHERASNPHYAQQSTTRVMQGRKSQHILSYVRPHAPAMKTK